MSNPISNSFFFIITCFLKLIKFILIKKHKSFEIKNSRSHGKFFALAYPNWIKKRKLSIATFVHLIFRKKNKLEQAVHYFDATLLIRPPSSCLKFLRFYPWISLNFLRFQPSRLVKVGISFRKNTAWKVSKHGVFLVRIFLSSDWIRKFTP